MDMPPVTAIGAKAAPVMATKAAQPPLTGIGTVQSFAQRDSRHSHQLLPTASLLRNQCVPAHLSEINLQIIPVEGFHFLAEDQSVLRHYIMTWSLNSFGGKSFS